MARRTVKFLSIRYGAEEEHPFQLQPDGSPLKVLKNKQASYGEEVEIERKSDLKRLEHFGAITTQEEQDELDANKDKSALEQAAEGSETAETPPDERSTSELAEWITETSPTINDLLELAHNDPDLAERLLDAENQATNNDPRTGLVQGLEKIMADRNQ